MSTQSNAIRLIVKQDGSLLDVVNPFIASLNEFANIIQVISPFPASDSVAVNYNLRNSRITNYTQYLRLLKDNLGNILYGKDVVDPSKPYYQTVKDWNVWQIAISSKALRAISKYHSGKINVSATFKEFKNFSIEDTEIYKGTFGSNKSTTRGDLPISAITGDYYVCDSLDFFSSESNLEYTLFDIAIKTDDGWIKGSSYEFRMNSASTSISVDPACIWSCY